MRPGKFICINNDGAITVRLARRARKPGGPPAVEDIAGSYEPITDVWGVKNRYAPDRLAVRVG